MTLAERLAEAARERMMTGRNRVARATEDIIAAAIREALREAAAVLRAQADLVEREYRLVYGTGTCAQAVGLREGAMLVRALVEEAGRHGH